LKDLVTPTRHRTCTDPPAIVARQRRIEPRRRDRTAKVAYIRTYSRPVIAVRQTQMPNAMNWSVVKKMKLKHRSIIPSESLSGRSRTSAQRSERAAIRKPVKCGSITTFVRLRSRVRKQPARSDRTTIELSGPVKPWPKQRVWKRLRTIP
jgi:hypothetical protein